jgi:hypothetical protein
MTITSEASDIIIVTIKNPFRIHFFISYHIHHQKKDENTAASDAAVSAEDTAKDLLDEDSSSQVSVGAFFEFPMWILEQHRCLKLLRNSGQQICSSRGC